VLDQIAAEKAGFIKIAKVNTQTDQHLAYQFGIRGVPTLILYYGGKKINEISGALPKHQLEAWIHSSLV
jgi:thioredoxin-like negative regulator of GroEL